MKNYDSYSRKEIYDALNIILQSHKMIKDQSNNLKRYGIDAEPIIKEYDKILNPSIADFIDAVLDDRKK